MARQIFVLQGTEEAC
uniref:Uncharacterized protein n=1 Tax=Rhizophora mucronata TaxID=61149 RepID=A0A2P2QCM0_RHIMU